MKSYSIGFIDKIGAKMEKVVWTLWWQGENNAPAIVKACINSMKVNIPYAEVIVLDKNNISNYIDIPEYILDKFKKGIITITHLSDIIRMRLLYSHGGLWLDSTVYINEKVPEKLFDLNFFTIKNYDPKSKLFSKNRWCGFLLGAKSKSRFFRLQCELLDSYWKNEDSMIDYLLIDYFIGLVLFKDNTSKNNYNKCPVFEGDILQMQRELSTNRELDTFPIFNKLSWKDVDVDTSIDSVYLKILKNQGIKFSKVINQNRNTKMRKIRSGVKHTLAFLNIKRIKHYGFKIQFYQYINKLLRTNDSKFSFIVYSKYNILVERYLSKYVDKILDN